MRLLASTLDDNTETLRLTVEIDSVQYRVSGSYHRVGNKFPQFLTSHVYYQNVDITGIVSDEVLAFMDHQGQRVTKELYKSRIKS